MRRLSASTNTGRAGSNVRSALTSSVSKRFCDGCGTPAQAPSSEPRCAASASRSSVCAPAGVQGREQTRLAAAGRAHQRDVRERLRQGDERVERGPPIGFVAAIELARLPADHIEQRRHRTRAFAAAPAIDQRPPVARPVGESRFQMVRDIARDQRRADPRGFERRYLLVRRADQHALFVAQHGRVERARNMVFREFERRAHIDDFIEITCFFEADE